MERSSQSAAEASDKDGVIFFGLIGSVLYIHNIHILNSPETTFVIL